MSAIVDLAGRALWPVAAVVKEVGSLYSEINPATLSGAIDIIVIRHPNGELFCSPFHVRFGKLKLFRPSEKLVELCVNGKVVDIPMKVGEAGEAFFVIEAENPVPSEYATSPIVSPVEPPVQDETLKDFSLTVGNNTTAVDPTLSDEMNYLHIGADSEQAQQKQSKPDDLQNELNDDHDFSKDDLPNESPIGSIPINVSSSIPADRPISHPKVQLNAASSPPWSWQWGGLPERRNKEGEETEFVKKGTLKSRASTPLLSNSDGSPPLPASGMMTIQEKVGNYLESGIPPPLDSISIAPPPTESTVASSSTAIAVGQDLEDDQVCLNMTGAAGTSSEYIICSSCGPLTELLKLDTDQVESRFSLKMLEFEDICDRPDILTAPTTVYRIYGYYHSWNTAAPIIMSQVLFQRPLSSAGLRQVIRREDKITSGSGGWFSWGRSTGPPKKLVQTQAGLKHKASEPIIGHSNNPSPPRTARLAKGVEETESLRSTSPSPSTTKSRHNYAKSLRLTSDQLKSLDLKDGVNTVQFSVYSSFQGKAVCSAKIFLWNHDAKIVISDVDGTITKSDVLGHVFTMVGRDWTHAGVANLYTNISKNGYHFLYLTSRAIGQAGYTREYLANVEQDQLKLPEGPVLLSPDRLVQAFTREVIQRRPQEFKMQCLKDVKKLFVNGVAPFYAGFGNRITDAMSYRSVEIPSSRIFTIDPSGEVKLELLANFKTTYVKLNETVDHVFPPTTTQNPEYSDFSFWKNDYSTIQIDLPADVLGADASVSTEQLTRDLEALHQREEEEDDDSFGNAEEVSIASMELQEHLSAMQNTKF